MNTLLLVAMIIMGLFGIGFIFVPGAVLAPLGIDLTESATTVARMFGAALISLTVLQWFAWRSDNHEYRKGVVSGLVVYNLIGTLLLLAAQVSGQMNAMGWSLVVLHFVFLLWFGYFLIKKT
jgi:tellurite resistance protein TehA-like permease